MASKIFEINGRKYRRSARQGRNPSGLGKPKLVRLYESDEDVLRKAKDKLGYLYNENELIRSAVNYYLKSVYIELINT